MASVKVYKMDGSESGTLDLNAAVFEADSNGPLVHVVAVALQNAKRQGNHETKTRSEVRGGGKKPFRQKGTGSARRGSTREPHLKGGGTVFGPHKRSYRQNVTTAVKRRALCCVLSDRVRNESLSVLEEVSFAEPKTKPFAEMVQALAPGHKKTLVVTSEANPNVLLSARNLPRVNVQTASDLNALDVLDAPRVLVEKAAVAQLEARLAEAGQKSKGADA
jgi:large subunit ribosomal protein L4